MRLPDARTWLIAAAVGAAVWACRRAASVILDLPPAAPTSSAPNRLGSPATQGARVAQQAPPAVAATPPIEQLRSRDSILALLPRDSSGAVDWAAAVHTGVIRPRAILPGRPAPPTTSFAYDFVFDVAGGDFDARFPHSTHTEWLACSGCHATIYRYRGRRTSMDAIDGGESCGVCHGKVAFSTGACWRCHPQQAPSGHVNAALTDDITFTRDTTTGGATYPLARFSHALHRIRYQCTSCHSELFAMQRTRSRGAMIQMRQGRSCGACHDSRNAFGLEQCARCHSPAVETRATGPGK